MGSAILLLLAAQIAVHSHLILILAPRRCSLRKGRLSSEYGVEGVLRRFVGTVYERLLGVGLFDYRETRYSFGELQKTRIARNCKEVGARLLVVFQTVDDLRIR